MPKSTSQDQTQLPAPILTQRSSTSVQIDTTSIDQSSVPHRSNTTASQAERNFFGALAQKVRERSRSRGRKEAKDTETKFATPSSPASAAGPSTPMSPRPRGHRQSSGSSSMSAKRISTSGSELSEFEKFSYGRHSNDVGFLSIQQLISC